MKNACTFDSFSPREGSDPRYTSSSVLSPSLSFFSSSSISHSASSSSCHQQSSSILTLSPSIERPGGSNPSSQDSSFLPFHPFSHSFSLFAIQLSRDPHLKVYEYGGHIYDSSRGRRRQWSGKEDEERAVNGTRATAQKAKVIEHDLSVGRHFYRRPSFPLSSSKVAVTTCGSFMVLLARA